MAKALMGQFCNSSCRAVGCAYTTLNSISNVNIVEWLVSIPAAQVFVGSALELQASDKRRASDKYIHNGIGLEK